MHILFDINSYGAIKLLKIVKIINTILSKRKNTTNTLFIVIVITPFPEHTRTVTKILSLMHVSINSYYYKIISNKY
jgi:hypothetical protein